MSVEEPGVYPRATCIVAFIDKHKGLDSLLVPLAKMLSYDCVSLF
jgi:hypothetical protein